MNEKEIAELRRRFRPDRSSITHIRGCFVNESREIVSQFDQSMGMLGQDDAELILATIRRTLSGTLGKNLVDIEFATAQVVDGDEHKLLMVLRDSALKHEDTVQALFQRVIASLDIEGNYLILLARDAYDVPYRSQDGEKQADASSESFSYILCSICPVKLTKPALSYAAERSEFSHLKVDWVVSPPELGFLFPAFDDRSTNLYGALYYTKDVTESHKDFIDAIFRTEPPMPAAAQKETFQSLLGETLADECSYEVVQAVQGELCGMIAVHKESKEPEPLVLNKGAVRRVLSSCGVSKERADIFEVQFDDSFGEETELSPRNLVDTKQIEVRTPDVKIQISPDRGDLLETRVIDGAKYILIRADEGVEVNGVNIKIK
ncbi:conserved hypothetical protein [uncultured Eubacteriales bacterium]|uniref:DUF4317 domain-containing protein n=1 Tax=uncultured Eubacteriales bacterium TaxID=172733 RepID=A0A212KA33_9FIRM|nr:conserved hypothetical protein [uncultured Eubacteriales bacterium]